MLIFKMIYRSLPRVCCSSIHKNFELPCIKSFIYVSNRNQVTLYKTIQIVSSVSHKITNMSNVRFKSKKQLKKEYVDTKDDENEGNENEEADSDDEELNIKGVEVKVYPLQNLRIDLILSKALGQRKKTIEESLYQNKLRHNGKNIFKKAENVKIGDVIDLIKNASKQNSRCIIVDRLDILGINVNDEETHFLVKIRKTKNLTIENYQGSNKWDSPSSES